MRCANGGDGRHCHAKRDQSVKSGDSGTDYDRILQRRTAVEALKTGALDYLIKPLDFDNLQATLEKALAHTHSIDAETPAVTASQFGMVGKSPAMQHLLSEIALVAPSEATVLIHGDSGTGKELVAVAIHASSARSENRW